MFLLLKSGIKKSCFKINAKYLTIKGLAKWREERGLLDSKEKWVNYLNMLKIKIRIFNGFCIHITSHQVQFQKISQKCHFGNLGAGADWPNLGSLQTPQGHRGPPEAPAELHWTGARVVSIGPGDNRGHLPAAGDDVAGEEEEDDATEVRRDSWVRRSWLGPEMRGQPPVNSSRGTGPGLTPIPTLTSPRRRRISCRDEPRRRM